MACLEKKDYDAACRSLYCRGAIWYDPKGAALYCSRGDGYKKKGELTKAIADYTVAIGMEPKLAQAYYNRGVMYGLNGENDKAIADYNEAIRLNPKIVEAYYNRGTPTWRRANMTRQLPTTTRPFGWTRKMSRRIATVATPTRRRRYDQAIADYNEAIRLDPKDVTAYATGATPTR